MLWKFIMLDVNRNDVSSLILNISSFCARDTLMFSLMQELTRKESKAAKTMFTSVVSGRPEQRKCARNFLRYCDADDNLKISREEWVECLKLEGEISENHCVVFGSTESCWASYGSCSVTECEKIR